MSPVAAEDDRWTLLIVPRNGTDDTVLARHHLIGLTERDVRSMFGLRRGRVPQFLPIPVDREHLRMLRRHATTALDMSPDATGELWREAAYEAPDDVDEANSHELRRAAIACIVYVVAAALLWLLKGGLSSGWLRTATGVAAWLATGIALWCTAAWGAIAWTVARTRQQ